jgi:hypothetical protein
MHAAKNFPRTTPSNRNVFRRRNIYGTLVARSDRRENEPHFRGNITLEAMRGLEVQSKSCKRALRVAG